MAKKDFGDFHDPTDPEKDTFNRKNHVVWLITQCQIGVATADANSDLIGMYQALQLWLDVLTPDFKENYTEDMELIEPRNPKNLRTKFKYKGSKTKKFATYRALLDNAKRRHDLSNTFSPDSQQCAAQRRIAYHDLQTLKYGLIDDTEEYGYNATMNDPSHAWQE